MHFNLSVIIYYEIVIIQLFSFNWETICTHMFFKKLKLHLPYGLMQF